MILSEISLSLLTLRTKASPLMRNIEEARQAIFGLTIGNDISERNWQSSDLQWIRAKASDGFAPVGPFLVQGVDWSDLMVSTYVNGELRQNESTAMI